MEKKTNILGLDSLQTAVIKRNYLNVKSYINKRNKYVEQAKEFAKKANELDDTINDLDILTYNMTEKVLGFRLSSEQCMRFLENPEEFEYFKKENGLEEEVKETSEESTENTESKEEVEALPFEE